MAEPRMSRGSLRDWVGAGGSNAGPPPHTPTPRYQANGLTASSHFRIMKQARVASLR